MTTKIIKSLLATTAVSLAVVGAAQAGGFSRGKADTQILYEDGNFNMRSSMTYVSPTKKYASNPGNPALNGHNITEDYVVPSFAIKANITDNVRCATTLVQNNGGSVSYGPGKDIATPDPVVGLPVFNGGKKSESFTTYEAGLTCAVKIQAGKGNFYLLGGGFAEQFNYSRQNTLGFDPGTGWIEVGTADLTLKGRDYGYRIGAAYDIPEIAMRAELLYRSATSYGATGTFTSPIRPVPAIGTGNLPQSVELNLQSGIAPGWLAFGSVKWMDWSVTKQLIAEAPLAAISDANDYYWRDGWTVTGGVGHAFNEQVSGLAAITWDRGVGTGYDHSFDTWTLSLGGSFKDGRGGEFRGGIGYSFLEGGCETMYGAANTCMKDGYALAGNIGYAIKW